MQAAYMNKVRNITTYLINGTGPFIIVHMTIHGNVNLVLLPKFLKVVPSHWFSKGSLFSIKRGRRVTKYTMCKEDQPWLLLSINRSQTVLNKPILFCSLSPIMFRVSYTEPEHAKISGVPRRKRKMDKAEELGNFFGEWIS